MTTLADGANIALTLSDYDSVTVSTRGVVTVEAVSGLGVTAGKIEELTGTRTFGPYAVAGSLKLASLGGSVEYEVADGATPGTPALFYRDSSGNVTLVGQNVLMPLVPAATVAETPFWLRGEYIYNCLSHDNIVVKNGIMWAVVWRDDSKPYLLRKAIGAAGWASFDLSTITGSPLGTAANDSHNFLSLAISGDGKMHITGNVHNNPLKYVVGTVAGWNVAGSWAAGAMIGTDETDVTYPSWIDTGDGNLLFFYRDGVSSNGNGWLNKYSNGVWTRLSKLFGNGKVPTHANTTSNAYPSRFVVDAYGVIHVAFTWRGDGTADSNWAICYAKSVDKGVTWTTSAGATYALPIQPATSEVLMDGASSLTGLLNQQLNGLSVDSAGKVHAICMKRDPTYTQYYYITNKSGAWVTQAVTAWDYTYDISVNPISNVVARPDIACMPDGRVLVLYRHSAREKGALWALDITNPAIPRRFKLADIELQAYEPSYSGQALREYGRLVMLVTNCEANGNASTDGGYFVANNWYSQLGFVLDTDARPDSPIPYMETIGSFSGQPATTAGTNVTGTADGTASPIIYRCPVVADGSGSRRMFRAKAMHRQNTSGTLTLQLVETPLGGGAAVTTASIVSTSTAVVATQGPLFASRKFVPEAAQQSGYVDLMAKVTANSADVFGAHLEILRLSIR